MVLYHGSTIEIQKPIIITSEKGRDFGFAFYLTPIKEQAERMAKRKQKIAKSKKAIVSVFEWNENKKDIQYKCFSQADLAWLEMVIKCRSDIKYKHGFDVIEGKIADDSVGETISFVADGVIKKEDAVERLKFQKINSQIAFCSEKSLKDLKFVSSYEVKQWNIVFLKHY